MNSRFMQQIYWIGFPGIQRLSWNPILTDRERKHFEEAARREELREISKFANLTHRDDSCEPNPAKHYAPVYFVEPRTKKTDLR